jgi:hypothetical protein
MLLIFHGLLFRQFLFFRNNRATRQSLLYSDISPKSRTSSTARSIMDSIVSIKTLKKELYYSFGANKIYVFLNRKCHRHIEPADNRWRSSSKTSVNFYRTVLRGPENTTLRSHRRENLRFHEVAYVSDRRNTVVKMSQEIPHLSEKIDVHYLAHKNPPMESGSI